MSKITKTSVGVAVVAVAVVVGIFVGKLIFDQPTPTKSNATNSVTNSSQPSPTKITSILAQPQNYIGKDVTVTGSVYKVSDGNYYVVQSESKPTKDTPNSIALDLSKTNINLSKYANDGSTTQTKSNSQAPKTLKPTATITGKFTNGPSAKQFVIVVSSLQ